MAAALTKGVEGAEGFGGWGNEALDVDTGSHHNENVELVGLAECDEMGDKVGNFDQ